ncbi:hypothetical protein BH11GEM2_BH11GEM2_00710 [soil metagenome]
MYNYHLAAVIAARPQGAYVVGNSTYSHLRANLADVWDKVEDTQEPVIVSRKGHQDLAILPADELASIQETAHLLRSPKNARRLIEALTRAIEGKGVPTNPDELAARLRVAKASR